MSDSDGEVFEVPSAAAEPAAEPEAEPAAAEAWWVEVVHKIIAGDKVPAALASLATQEKAQHFAREERLAAEAASTVRADKESASNQALLNALASRDQQLAELRHEVQAIKDKKDDPEPEHREFVSRAVDNPVGVVVGSERAGSKAEPQLRFYPTEKAFSYLEDKGGKDFHNFQVLESSAEALFDIVGSLKNIFPVVIAKVNPDGAVDETDPQYIAERELCKVYNTVKAVYDNVVNPQLSYLQTEAILQKKYGGSSNSGWVTQILSSIQKSIHGLVGTPLPDNLAPKFTTAMHDLEERFSTAIIKNAAMQASRTQSRSPFQQSAAGGFGSTARSREQAGQPRQRARFQPPSSGAAGPR